MESREDPTERLASLEQLLHDTQRQLREAEEELQSYRALEALSVDDVSGGFDHQETSTQESSLTTKDLAQLLEGASAGIILLDQDLRVRRYSPEVAHAFGRRTPLLGERLEALGPPFDEPALTEDSRAVLGGAAEVVRELATHDGRSHTVRLSAYRAPLDSSTGVLLTFADIVATALPVKSGPSDEQRLRQLLQSTAEGVIGLDRDGLCYFVNRPAVDLLGCDSESDVLGGELCPYVHEAVEEGDPECDICDSLVSGEPVHCRRGMFRRKDGTRFTVDYWSHPTRIDGQLTGAVVTFFDATHRRRTEQELQLRSRLLELSNDAIVVWRLDSHILFWNRGAESNYGFSNQEAVGRPPHELLKTTHPEGWDVIREQMLKNGDWTGEVQHVTKTGAPVRVSCRYQLVQGLEGDNLVLEVHRDLTETLRVQRELNEAREEAEFANRAKSAFLANMSHELRTPLSAILGYADILLAEVEGETNQERVSTIRTNGAFLLDLLNDILDLSKIEAGKMVVAPEPVELPKLLSDVATLMRIRSEAKDVPLRFTLKSAIPRVMRSDPRRLRQVLVNLLGNAVKFTENGEIALVAGVTGEGESRHLVIEVSDTGIGIDREDLRKIFRPFEQSERQRDSAVTGTGLGLSISRLLARELGGRIDVVSEVGVGSRFKLTLQLDAPSDEWVNPSELNRVVAVAPEHQEESRDHRLDGSRILIADDRRDIRHVAEYFLRRAGAEVVEAEDGQQVLDIIAAEQGAGRMFHLVLMDMQMPKVDGYQATKRLVAAGFDRPIIALTAAAMKGERQRCLEAGCTDYLSKPIDGATLVEVCTMALAQAAALPQAVERRPHP